MEKKKHLSNNDIDNSRNIQIYKKKKINKYNNNKMKRIYLKKKESKTEK